MTTDPPTVVLVHGAFTDAGSWAGVTERLQAAGVRVQVPANPLRGLTHDGEYLAGSVREVTAPVVLVGHGYGGAVITHAGTRVGNVCGLALVASFGLDQGQSVQASTAAFPATLLAGALEPWPHPEGNAQALEVIIRPERFAQVYAADLPAARAAVLAVSQRPLAATALDEPLDVPPAWRTHPAWFLVTTGDQAVHPDAQRAAARRLNAAVIEVAASHAVALSQPETVTVFVLKDLATLGLFA